MTSEGTNFLFVIDTNQYAGNFEREMCAYLTGHVGECEVGKEMAARFPKNKGDIFENIAFVPDENGCSRPVTIWPNPRWGNDGMGGHFLLSTLDQKEACAKYVKSVESIYGGYIKNTQHVLNQLLDGKVVSNWTITSAKQDIARHQKEIDKAKKLKKVSTFPAYMSVGIWFETKPTQKQLDLLKERAGTFLEAYNKANKQYEFRQMKDFVIEGFRLVTFNKTSKEEKV